MHLFESNSDELSGWIRDEVELNKPLGIGNRGMAVKRLQVWLNIRGFGLVVDSDFGPVTAPAVGRFQASARLPMTGRLDEATFSELVAPMLRTLRCTRRGRAWLGAMIVDCGNRRLREHPIENGGQNCGPWVRLYMKGNDGAPWGSRRGLAAAKLRRRHRNHGPDGRRLAVDLQHHFIVARLHSGEISCTVGKRLAITTPPGDLRRVRRRRRNLEPWLGFLNRRVGDVCLPRAIEIHDETIVIAGAVGEEHDLGRRLLPS